MTPFGVTSGQCLHPLASGVKTPSPNPRDTGDTVPTDRGGVTNLISLHFEELQSVDYHLANKGFGLLGGHRCPQRTEEYKKSAF